MPFQSSKQRRFMAARKSGSAARKCPPKDVVAEFFASDRMDRMGSHGREAKQGRPRGK